MIPLCGYCDEEALDSEDCIGGAGGQRFHRECMIRAVAGSAAHQLKECPCYGGVREDPPGMTKREAAKLALETYEMLLIR